MDQSSLEAQIGMSGYYTDNPGLGGILKQEPEDFIVEEINEKGTIILLEGDDSIKDIQGDYAHFTLVKRNWDTIRAVKEVSKALWISQRRLGFAGTKDKRALTSQRVSVGKIGLDKLKNIRIKDITIKDIRYADDPIRLGDLWGNRFSIVLRHINKISN